MLPRLFFLLLIGLSFVRAGEVQILLPDGVPAEAATGAPVKAGCLYIYNAVFGESFGERPPAVHPDGRMAIPESDFGRWVFVHPMGWADLMISADTKEVRLQPWSEVRGTLDPKNGRRIDHGLHRCHG